MNLTEWYPDSILPIREGDYDVIEWPPKMLSTEPGDPVVVRACFCKKYGQLGFWLETSTPKKGNWANNDPSEAPTRSWRLLNVCQWRGRLKVERVKLLVQEEVACAAPGPGEQLPLELPGASGPRKRVQLNADA
ncbi:MAG: hypothetical protein E6Q97_36810 [Desulfurellales bacterium]|nr:MAG: hypothetical protein E6Q97_36810 [Desulfurellales bacterium]